jgi:hypothetical protein
MLAGPMERLLPYFPISDGDIDSPGMMRLPLLGERAVEAGA